ncbi:NeuD/PglB/VioB family sugar acetyltransferase [Jatrophihabitans sp. DSM 45814]
MALPLILVAASGLAREAAEAVRADGKYEPIGFVDDNEDRWGSTLAGLKVLGDVSSVASFPDAALILCAGKGKSRQAIADRLTAEGVDEGRYATVVHPNVALPVSCSVGVGSVILGGCVLTADVTLGRHVVCMPNVTLTHDDQVEDFATLCAGVTLGGSVHIGTRAYIGMHTSVRENRVIGRDALVGMGSVVLSDVPVGQTWFGSPASNKAAPV